MIKYISTIFLMLFFGSMVHAQRVSGLVFHQGRSEAMANVGITFIYEIGRDFQTHTNAEGKFAFRKVKRGLYRVRVSGFAIADTVLNGFEIIGDTSLTVNYSVYCRFDRSARDKRCPVCGKEDAVVPIRYGLIGTRVPKEERPTNDSIRAKQLDYLPGGCIISFCDPNWHCRRDSVEF